MTEKASSVQSASTIQVDRVVNTDGEMLGHVMDLVLNLEDGRIAYALVSTAPASEAESDRLQIVPWELVHMDNDNACLVLDVERDQLESAPSFDRDERPDLSDPHLQRMVYGHYGYTVGVAA